MELPESFTGVPFIAAAEILSRDLSGVLMIGLEVVSDIGAPTCILNPGIAPIPAGVVFAVGEFIASPLKSFPINRCWCFAHCHSSGLDI